MSLDPNEQLLLDLLDAQVQFIVVGGLLPYSEKVEFHGKTLHVLGLRRLIQAKSAAGRSKDKMVLPILLATLEAKHQK